VVTAHAAKFQREHRFTLGNRLEEGVLETLELLVEASYTREKREEPELRATLHPVMSHLIIGTAGHVDHGKTSLIRALTGIETDRLKEEQARGLSIDLGFAHFKLPGGAIAGIVDVPGHERFVKNMLAGAAGMDVVLFVVAADEGVMPQTVEHLDILQLLEAQHGIVVLTKRDLVDADWLELIQDDLRARLAGTFLAESPIVPVSSTTREGLDELAQTIESVCAHAAARDVQAAFRLPVDRAFTIAGFGTVVTGTATAGRLRVGEEAEVLPQQLKTRVRNLEVHGAEVEMAEAGQRVAINLTGIERAEVVRGNVVAAPGVLQPTQLIDVKLRLLPTVKRPLKDGTTVRLHLGTAEFLPRILLLDQKQLEPGASGYAQLVLDQPGVCARGDRFVVRTYSPMHTIGGGIVLEPSARRRRRFQEATIAELRALEQGDVLQTAAVILKAAGERGVTVAQFQQRLAGTAALAKEVVGQLQERGVALFGSATMPLLHREVAQTLRDNLLTAVRKFHADQPLKQGIARELLRAQVAGRANPATFDALLAQMGKDGQLVASADMVRLAEHKVAMSEAEQKIADQLERTFRDARFAPPHWKEQLERFGPQLPLAQKVFYSLVEAGKLVRVGDLAFHGSVVDQAKRVITEHIKRNGKMTVADFRNLTDSSRKFAVPLVEHMDKIGFTRRVGDDRLLRETAKAS